MLNVFFWKKYAVLEGFVKPQNYEPSFGQRSSVQSLPARSQELYWHH